MTDDAEQQERRVFGWALPGSLAVHAAAAALLIFGFPDLMAQPQKEEAIQVSLVPPPPEPAPEPEKAEPPPPPPPPPEQAKVEPPPPPEPEEPKPEEPTPEAKSETPMDNIAGPMVFEFGDKDSGPKLSPNGNSAEEPAKTEPEEQPTPEPPAETAAETPEEPDAAPPEEAATPAEPAETTEDAEQAETQETPAPAEAADTTEPPAQPDSEPGEIVASKSTEDAAPTPAEPTPAAEPPPVIAIEPEEEVKLPEVATAPTPKPVELAAKSPDKEPVDTAAKARKPPAETARQTAARSNADARVKRATKPRSLEDIVASLQSNDGASATTDMRNLTRGERVGELCRSGLQQRLLGSFANLGWVPRPRQEVGNVVSISKAGFSVGQDWYDLSFVCTVDTAATRVVSLTMKIGGLVPRSEWKSRRFPTQ